MTQTRHPLTILGLLLAAFLCSNESVTAQTPPNVVLIFADDLGYGDLGCYGATRLKTPNIDKLAAEGCRFTDAHSPSAVCTPSRYGLLTGQYPHRRNLYAPVFLKSGLVIDTQQQTIASVFKAAGYKTGIIGKWHLGFGEEQPDWNGELKPGPLELGFDYYFGVPVVNSHAPFVYVENHRVVGHVPEDPFVYGKRAKTKVIPEKMKLNAIGGADAAHALYVDEQVGTKLTEKAVDWIKECGDEKFFLFFSTTNIHHPFTPHPRFRGTSECGIYGDFVHELDWIVGEVVRTLDERGVLDDTLIIVTSDNGGMLNATGQKTVKMGHDLNGDLLGYKFDGWEGGHRVPFIARWHGQVKSGTTSDEVICHIDLLETFAALTQQSLKQETQGDGVNILSTLTGEGVPDRDHLLLSPLKSSHLAVRKGDWVYIDGQGGGGFGSRKLGDHGLGGPAAIGFSGHQNSDIENGKLKKNAPPGQLYNLRSDPNQTANRYQDYPEMVEQMRSIIAKYRATGKSRKKKPRR